MVALKVHFWITGTHVWNIFQIDCVTTIMLLSFFSVCGDLPDAENGVYILDSLDSGVGATATLRCDVGFATINPDVASLTCETSGDGGAPNWSDTVETCVAIGMYW